MTPAVATADLSDDMAVIRELVEEYSSAQILDPRRAGLVAREIMDRAEAGGLFDNCGVDADTPIDEALTLLDAHLCDLGEVVIRDGLHVFGEGSGELARLRRRRAGGTAARTRRPLRRARPGRVAVARDDGT